MTELNSFMIAADGMIDNYIYCVLLILILGKMQVLDYILAMTKSTTSDKVVNRV